MELFRSEKDLPPQTRDEECSICKEALGGGTRWSCGQCKAQFHITCVADAVGEGVTPTGAIKRKYDNTGTKMPIVCCICKADYDKLQRAISKPAKAPWGIICCVCRRLVSHGEEAQRCGNFQECCSAWWHPACRGPRDPCEGCGDNIWQAINRRSKSRQRQQ